MISKQDVYRLNLHFKVFRFWKISGSVVICFTKMRLRELDVAFGFCSSNSIRDDFLVYNDRDHDQLIFVNGRRLVSFDVNDKASFFFTQELSSNVTCVTASSDKQYVATACEYNRKDETIVFIHKISSRKLASTFRHQERVSAICFSTESKHLILACTSSIIVLDLKKECIILNGAIDAACSRISCPSRLSTSRLIACVSGPGGYCTLWSAFPSQQLSNISLDCRGLSDMKLNYVDHAWICKGEANDFFVAFIVEPFLNANTNVHIYVVHNVNTTQRLRMEFLQEIQNHDSQLRSITNLNQDSFAVSGTKGMIFVYNHDARSQQQKYLFSCSKSFLGSHDNCFNSIKQSTISNEIYVADFHKRKVLKVAIESEDCNDFSEVLSDAGHIGGILQIDSCYERPILMSCGMNDEMVYVWNYAQKRKIAKFDCKNDEPLSLAIHPSGYYAAVGFNERLTTFHILAESIKSHRSVLCHNPVSLLSFSAKYLAAVIGNTINLYEVYQKNASSCLILVSSFTGHIGSIKCICWSVDTFFSGGIDKNFYGWNIAQSSRIDNMNVLRSSGYCESIAFVSSSMRYDAACITSNGSLHRLFWSGNISEVCNVVSHTSEGDDTMSCLAFNSQDSMLVVGTYSGTIKCYTWSYTPENFSFHCTSTIPLHRSDPKSSSLTHAICCIRSAADNVMISGGTIDGSIFAISLDEHESIMASSHSPYENRGMVHAVLISADDYETKSNTIQTLNTKIKHLIAENEYNSHSRDMLWKGELDSLSRKAEVSLEEERYVVIFCTCDS